MDIFQIVPTAIYLGADGEPESAVWRVIEGRAVVEYEARAGMAVAKRPVDDEFYKSMFPNSAGWTLGEWLDADVYMLRYSGDPLQKAQSVPAGARWITVFPNGRGEKGRPVLVQEHSPGSGTYHVIGGAGGKLNYLKLTGIKPESDYKKEAGERQKGRREAKKMQRSRDRELGLTETKRAQHEQLRAHVRTAEKEFVKTVAKTMGWDAEAMKPPETEGVSDAGKAKIAERHHADLVRRASDAVEAQRQKLLAEADAGEEHVPVASAAAEQLSIADIDPVQAPTGLGYALRYTERAKEHGATDADLAAERQDAKATQDPAQRASAVKRGATAQRVKEEIKNLRSPVDESLKTKLVDAKQTIELLKAQKIMRLAQKNVKAAHRGVDEATEVKAYNLDVGAAPEDADIEKDIVNDLRTVATRAFLSAVNQATPDYEKALQRHLGVGAYNSINALALAAGGSALVDRGVVDVLGVAGAAQVLARRLHADLKPAEVGRVAEGMERWHYDHYMDATKEALQQAQELQEQAAEITAGDADDGHDFEAARELNRRRANCVDEAQRVLGTTLGEMEANAALVVALKAGRTDRPLEVPLGRINVDQAILQARSIGLQRGDYTITKAGESQVLTVTPAGMDRLSAPVNRDDLELVRRNLNIIDGKEDEDDWLPGGFADRPDLAMPPTEPGVAPTLAEPFAPGDDMEGALRDYIGGRAADGDSVTDILQDIQSADFFAKAGAHADDYAAALKRLAPLVEAGGRARPPQSLAPAWDQLADEFVAKRYGAARSAINQQSVAIDNTAMDALHRALADHPAGIAAYKPIGELTAKDEAALRDHFYSKVARESSEQTSARAELEALDGEAPEKEIPDMFGIQSENPAWRDWRTERDKLAATVNSMSLTWPRYVDQMRGRTNAYAAMQDVIRSDVSKGFAEHYNRARPGAALKIGRTVIRNNLEHLDAVDPAAHAARLEKDRSLVDALRERNQGRYASGSVSDKMVAAREAQAGFEASQMGFFSEDEAPGAEERPLGLDERHTIGHEAERSIARMMPEVGRNFDPKQPVRLTRASMSGPGVARQRAVKMIANAKHVVLAAGVGSGKTSIQMGGFTHLREQGKAKRALFLTPSAVQGQFGAEALNFLQPGKFAWSANPGASRDERIATHRDVGKDFTVMTHQSFRDDMIHLGALHAGVDEASMVKQLQGMAPADRATWLKGVMDKEKINYDYLGVDEGHDLLNRAGKDDSGMAMIADALSSHMPYYVSASADPIKNDVSEAHDLLRKMDPARYADRNAFLRRYGPDTLAAKDGLRREMARHLFPTSIKPNINIKRETRAVTLSESQRAAVKDIEAAATSARLARIDGKVDIASLRKLSPAYFDGVTPENEESVAQQLSMSLGMIRDAAIAHAINDHPESAKLDQVSATAKAKAGKPGVVFARSRKAVENIATRLRAEGHRVVTLTGADTGKKKNEKRLQFRPEQGEASADIMVASDAGATGLNLQRGAWLMQFDTPQTAKTHAQRNGRIERMGQMNDIDLIDLVADHKSEHNARDRLKTKYGLREIMTSPLEGLDDTGLALALRQRAADVNPDGIPDAAS